MEMHVPRYFSEELDMPKQQLSAVLIKRPPPHIQRHTIMPFTTAERCCYSKSIRRQLRLYNMRKNHTPRVLRVRRSKRVHVTTSLPPERRHRTAKPESPGTLMSAPLDIKLLITDALNEAGDISSLVSLMRTNGQLARSIVRSAVRAYDQRGYGIFLWSVEDKQRPRFLRFLINHGADVHQATLDNYTALHEAAAQGNTAVTRLLLSLGVAVNAICTRSSYGGTPLALACAYGHIEVAELLLKHGANVNAGMLGVLPLFYACSPGPLKQAKPVKLADCALVGLLLKHGANINVRDCDGRTVLHHVVWRNDIQLATLLMGHGPDLDAGSYGGEVVREIAWYEGSVGICRALGIMGNTSAVPCY